MYVDNVYYDANDITFACCPWDMLYPIPAPLPALTLILQSLCTSVYLHTAHTSHIIRHTYKHNIHIWCCQSLSHTTHAHLYSHARIHTHTRARNCIYKTWTHLDDNAYTHAWYIELIYTDTRTRRHRHTQTQTLSYINMLSHQLICHFWQGQMDDIWEGVSEGGR